MKKALKHFKFRRDESDPVWAVNLCQGGICTEPDLCVLWACHQRKAHSLVRFYSFDNSFKKVTCVTINYIQVEGVRVT